MHVVLLHNPAAGSEVYDREDLIEGIRRGGHDVIGHLTHAAQLRPYLEHHRCDLVAVAGGDGTIGRVILEAAGSGVPVALLPVGTANNIARTLGYQGDPWHVVQTWPTSPRCGFDLVALTVESQPDPFVEAAGFGVFPDLIRCTEMLDTPAPEVALDCHITVFRSIAERFMPRPYEVTIDGVDHSGAYLLVQVMNVPLLGPNVPLAAAGTPSDGALDVVLVGESERPALVKVLRSAQAGKPVEHPLRSHHGREITIVASDDSYHVDGSLRRRSGVGTTATFEFRVQPHAVEVLTPQPCAPSRAAG